MLVNSTEARAFVKIIFEWLDYFLWIFLRDALLTYKVIFVISSYLSKHVQKIRVQVLSILRQNVAIQSQL